MDIQQLTDFFMWSTVINVGIFIYWIAWVLLAPELVYKIQSRFFPIDRENYNRIMYFFLGFYKVLIIVFMLIPYLVLEFLI